MNTPVIVKTYLSVPRVVLGVAALWVLVSAIASATTLTDSVKFTGATDFTPTGAPTDPLSGSITFTFDPAVAVASKPVDAISLTIDGVSFSPSNTLFSVSPTNCAPIQCAGGDRISINGLQSQVGFNFDFDTNSAQQIDLLFNFSYDVPSGAGLVTYKPLTGPASIVCVDSVCPGGPAAVPEPATLALFCLGLVGLGLSRHRLTRV